MERNRFLLERRAFGDPLVSVDFKLLVNFVGRLPVFIFVFFGKEVVRFSEIVAWKPL